MFDFNNVLEAGTTIVAVVAALKALEWSIGKITSSHDKSKQIDQTDADFQFYKEKTDREIEDLHNQVNDAHKYAFDTLSALKEELLGTLKEDKEEYFDRIKKVEDTILSMQGIYQQTVAVVELKIENLEKTNTKHLEQLKEAQNKHNNLMERTFILERESAVHEHEIKVANHRIDDLEKK